MYVYSMDDIDILADNPQKLILVLNLNMHVGRHLLNIHLVAPQLLYMYLTIL